MGKTLLSLLSEQVTIRFCNEVNLEISRHSNSNMPSINKRKNNVHKLEGHKRIKTYKEYELQLFDSVSNSGASNRGEKHNLVAAIDFDLCKKGRTGGIILLTDDQKAIKNVLEEQLGAFPILNIWDSFDVILFLYFRNKHFTFDIAGAAFRDINATLARDLSPETDPKKTQERLKKLKVYSNRLNRVKKIKTMTAA
ncbi:MAG: hypothetical protein OXH57_02630 [Ekhidna sp.]|nr:hypothetical protein [Ekhidna sp.]